LIDPLDVQDMHNLMARSYLIMTDSGGLQEEAPSLGKPVLVLRNETERPEAVKAGTVKLAGTEKENIIRLTEELWTTKRNMTRWQKRLTLTETVLLPKELLRRFYLSLDCQKQSLRDLM